MSGVSEGETHVAAMRLVCQSLEEHEQQGIEIQWDVLQQMLDQMDAILQGIADQRRDDAEEIETLKKERDAAAWQQQVDSANAEVKYLRDRLNEARSVNVDLQGKLDAARADNVEIRRRLNEETDRHRATNAEKIELFQQKEWANQHSAELVKERDAARAETVEVRQQFSDALKLIFESNTTGLQLWDQLQIRKTAAAELVKERDAALTAVSLQRAGIERLDTCLSKIRQHVAGMHEQEDLMEVLVDIRSALEELDAGTAPAPETEPAHCPECERWQRAKRIDSELVASKAKEIERLRAFVDKVRSVMDRQYDGVEFDDLSRALAEFDANSSATLTSSVVKDCLTTEPEGGK